MWAVVWIVIIVALVVISINRGRHGEGATPTEDWRWTDEVFRDPTTKRMMRVWVDPKDGSRHYVTEPGPPPSV
jgi:hypothetical protein